MKKAKNVYTYVAIIIVEPQETYSHHVSATNVVLSSYIAIVIRIAEFFQQTNEYVTCRLCLQWEMRIYTRPVGSHQSPYHLVT